MKWPSTLPHGVGYAEIQHPVLSRCGSTYREPISALLYQYRKGEILIPDYQRPACWTPTQQAEFVGALLEGAPMPCIYIREIDTEEGPRDELVDGQQRMDALAAWDDGKIPAILPSQGKCVWKKDMDWPGWRLSICFPVGRFRGTLAEAIGLYLALNTKGTPHTQQELDRVREMLEDMS